MHILRVDILVTVIRTVKAGVILAVTLVMANVAWGLDTQLEF